MNKPQIRLITRNGHFIRQRHNKMPCIIFLYKGWIPASILYKISKQ